MNGGQHTISVRVHDRPGVLSRIAQVFARRGYNIDSLVVSAAHTRGFSRMTIGCQGDPAVLDQIIKQLNKLVDVVRAAEHNPDAAVERELALYWGVFVLVKRGEGLSALGDLMGVNFEEFPFALEQLGVARFELADRAGAAANRILETKALRLV